jgi:hypothetical protein
MPHGHWQDTDSAIEGDIARSCWQIDLHYHTNIS